MSDGRHQGALPGPCPALTLLSMPGITAALNTIADRVWSLLPGARGPLPANAIRLVAHRGAHGRGLAIENTLPAFELCARAGVWGIELDVRLTRDGEPVIHHDPHCGRLFGRPDLQIDATDFDRLREAVPGLPHLSEVVAACAGRLHLMLEVKESFRHRACLPQQIGAALSGLEPVRDYHLMALEPDFLEGFTAVPRAALIDIAWFNPAHIVAQNLALDHGAVAGSFALLGTGYRRRLRAAGRKIGTGFVETEGALRREVHLGADWIFTNRALALQRLFS